MELADVEVVSDERVGGGGHLVVRRLRVRLVGTRGERTAEGSWDFVERPMGLDAVVVALHRMGAGGPEVLLRSALRMPLWFGRPERPASPLFAELVAGIVEPGEDGEAALRARAAAEVREEAGLSVEPASLRRLGPAVFPTPGMCAELFHLYACEVPAGLRAAAPEGDGSPFEQGARLEWVALSDALARCRSGAIRDLKTEVALRRLAEELQGPSHP